MLVNLLLLVGGIVVSFLVYHWVLLPLVPCVIIYALIPLLRYKTTQGKTLYSAPICFFFVILNNLALYGLSIWESLFYYPQFLNILGIIFQTLTFIVFFGALFLIFPRMWQEMLSSRKQELSITASVLYHSPAVSRKEDAPPPPQPRIDTMSSAVSPTESNNILDECFSIVSKFAQLSHRDIQDYLMDTFFKVGDIKINIGGLNDRECAYNFLCGMARHNNMSLQAYLVLLQKRLARNSKKEHNKQAHSFVPPKIKLPSASTLISIFLALTLCAVFVYCGSLHQKIAALTATAAQATAQAEELRKSEEELNKQISSLSSQRDTYEKWYNQEKETVAFFEQAVVFVPTPGSIYHKYDCHIFQSAKKFLAFNEENAKYQGYYPCTECF